MALFIAVGFALLFSRSLSEPAVLIARGLDKISYGDLLVCIPERGTVEIAGIAHSANNLAEQLKRE